MPALLRSANSEGDPGAFAIGLIGIGQRLLLHAVVEIVFAERFGDCVERLYQLDAHLPLPHALHQRFLLLDQQQLSIADDAHPVGNRLGLVDVMGG